MCIAEKQFLNYLLKKYKQEKQDQFSHDFSLQEANLSI